MESGSSRTSAASHDSPITGRFAPCLSSTLRFARVKPEREDNNLTSTVENLKEISVDYLSHTCLHFHYDIVTSGPLEVSREFSFTLCCEKGEH